MQELSEYQKEILKLILIELKSSIENLKDFCRENNVVMNMSEMILQLFLMKHDEGIEIDDGYARTPEEAQAFAKFDSVIRSGEKG